jgi:precorrin-6Y C5,15-methyltransferase (decarboxylating)
MVYAVEKNAAAAELIHKNKLKFDCCNIEIVQGAAPDILSTLPPPDSVFIGGTNGALKAVITEILARNPNARIVINAITLETLAEIQLLTAEKRLSGVEIVQIGVNFVQKAGELSLLKAQNPVFVISFGGTDDTAA